MSDKLKRYYARRAEEYDDVYRKPERQADLHRLQSLVRSCLSDRNVLEVACGTGYWTSVAAGSARSILATDVNDEVIQIARRRIFGNDRVRFRIQDAWSLEEITKNHDGGLAAFWLSHISRQRVREWLTFFSGKLAHGSRIVLIDNRFVEGSSMPLSRTDVEGNTYQQRRLADGSKHEIMKNFFSADELRVLIPPDCDEVTVIELEYYWLLSVRKRVNSLQLRDRGS